jgi:hypothetical protein
MEENLIQNERGNAVLLRLRGTNIFNLPLYRMVWSDSRLWYLGGKWCQKYTNLVIPMWVIEAWCPPERYGDPIEWAKNDLGPFPTKGDYEFAQASPSDVLADISDDQAQKAIAAIELSAALTIPQKMSLYKAEQEKKEKEKERILGDIVHDSKPAIHAKMPDHIERMDSFKQRHEGKQPDQPARTGAYIIKPGE